MKKLVFGVVLVLFAFACNNSKNENSNTGYTINGTIKGISTGTVKLISHNLAQRTSKTFDSATIKEGKFTLKGKVNVPQMVTVNIEPGNWAFDVFVEDTVLSVTADTTGSRYYDYSKYGGSQGANIKNVTETGSKGFNAWTAYQNDPAQHQYDSQMKELGKKIMTAKNVDTEYMYRDQLDEIAKQVRGIKYNWIDSFVTMHPTAVVGAYMFKRLYAFSQDMPFAKMNNIVTKFKGEAKESQYYHSLDSLMAMVKAVQPGSIAPDFTLMKRDSSKFTLSSLRGKYVMIDFWASWCHPCRKAIPHWKMIYNKYHNKGFDIVSVSDDSRWNDWFKALDQEKMPWIQVCDEFNRKNMPARVGSLYMTTFIPFYVLMDKEGKILVYTGDENKIDAKLKEIFGS